MRRSIPQMHALFSRGSRLATLAAGTVTAAVIALTAGSAAPALADTVDTGGSATVTFWNTFLLPTFKSGILVSPVAPGTSTFNGHRETATWPVTGGDAEINKLFGTVQLGGGMIFINTSSGASAVLTNLGFSLDDGKIVGTPAGTSKPVALVDIAGDLTAGSSAGPPATETFKSSNLRLDAAGAKFLNKALGTTVFKKGENVGKFATTWDVGTTP
jgi:hypothetical protein